MPATDIDAFFNAVKEGDRCSVEELVEREPRLLEVHDEKGRSGLLVAVYHGQHEVVNFLTEKRPGTDIFEASASGSVGRVRDLLRDEPGQARFTSPDGFSPLGLAAFFGHPEVVKELLQRDADPSVCSRNSMQVTPLHSAAAHGDDDVALRMCEMLLEHGADPNLPQTGGWRPLHQAVSHGNLPLLRLLLDHGADPDVVSDDGRTPLSMAPPEERDRVAELLRER